MQRRRFPWLLSMLVFVVSIGTSLVAEPAEALQIAEEEGEYELSLNVFGQGELTIRDAGGSAPLDYGFSVSKARLKSQATWNDVGSLKIQVGGAGGMVVLKDMVATLSIADPVHFRIGRFKTPISAEYNISSADLIMVDRALLRGLIPGRRIGGDVRLMLGGDEEGDIAFTGQLGLFNPVNRTFSEPQGHLLTARALLELGFGLDIHASYGQVILADNEPIGANDGMENQFDRPQEPFSQTADVALQYNEGRINAHAEAVAVFDAVDTDEIPVAFYSHFGYRIGPEDGINVEPMVGYDYGGPEPRLVEGSTPPTYEYETNHRMTVGANLYWLDSHLISTINYRLETRGDLGHAAFLQLQAQI